MAVIWADGYSLKRMVNSGPVIGFMLDTASRGTMFPLGFVT